MEKMVDNSTIAYIDINIKKYKLKAVFHDSLVG